MSYAQPCIANETNFIAKISGEHQTFVLGSHRPPTLPSLATSLSYGIKCVSFMYKLSYGTSLFVYFNTILITYSNFFQLNRNYNQITLNIIITIRIDLRK